VHAATHGWHQRGGSTTIEKEGGDAQCQRLASEILEPMRRQLGIAHRVLNVLVAEPGLQRPRVVAGIGQRIAAAMAQHVRMESVEPQGRWLESGRKLIAMAPLGGEPSARRR
jgi:hypothetical protein